MLMPYSVVNDKKGFTLLEMMIVVTLIAILSAVAVISIKSNMPQYYLSGAARQVLTDLMLARSKAVSNNSATTVTFSSTGYSIGGVTTDISSQFRGVTLSTKSTTGIITFYTMGTTSGSDTITLTSPGLTSKLVVVSAAGGVRIQ
jgi:prepilin-type N-terminal cleavage/methylation domain-containing protein